MDLIRFGNRTHKKNCCPISFDDRTKSNFIVPLDSDFVRLSSMKTLLYFVRCVTPGLKQHVTTSKKGQYRRSVTKLLIVRASAMKCPQYGCVEICHITLTKSLPRAGLKSYNTSHAHTSYIVAQVTYIHRCLSLWRRTKEQNAIIDSQEQC